MQKGKVSVNTENIFPIIKKFLYTDHEIFLRELVSNAVDASQKIKMLASSGEYNGELGDLKIKVSLDEKKKTITISDSGIGMTAEEIDKYINQIAFSGAEEFVEKYKDSDDKSAIIGHFGLGFYSSFMVATKVEIDSLSHAEGAEPAHWECEGTTDFKIKKGKRKKRGTDIILHIGEDGKDFLEKFQLQQLLDKYCKFLPIEIEFDDKIVNKTTPIWKRNPADLKDEDYEEFYKEMYPMAEPPLFWIHLNVDFPFNLTGVLYFPKIKSNYDPNKSKIQLYSNQVYVTDNVKDIVPEYLMLLHGVLDSPDIPLNVSRSSLQADSQVKKITGHISKKVSDKLWELFKDDRTKFEEKWEYLHVFVKFGMLSDEKFEERAKKFALLPNTEDKHATIEEYLTAIEATQTDKDGNKIGLYTTDTNKQHTFIQKAKSKGYDVLVMDDMIDHHFIGQLEMKNEKFQLKRVDADTLDKLIDKDEKHENLLKEDDVKVLNGLFGKLTNEEKYEVVTEPLSIADPFVAITVPEFDRRMEEMSKMGGGMPWMMGNNKSKYKLVVNTNHKLAAKLSGIKDEKVQSDLGQQAFDLALLEQNLLEGEQLSNFIERSQQLMSEVK